MNFSNVARLASRSSQENVLASNRMDSSRMDRAKQRTILGVLTENEQHSRSFGQGLFSKRGSILDNSHTNLLGCPSSSSADICVDEPCEVVIPASGELVAAEVVDEETAAMQHKDFRLFLDLSSGSCMDTSMQSLPDNEALTTQNAMCLAEYSEDIHKHLRKSEIKCHPKSGYMRKQPDITNCMRVILVDWLVEVGQEYKLCGETIYLAVNYMDRFLSCMSVLRGKLQLVGTAALLLAAKYEEIYPPEVDDFVYITDDTYTKKQLLRMEHFLLKVLAFDMTVPTTHQFLRHFLTVQAVCFKTESLALYVAELSMLEVDPFLHYFPSVVAAAAFCLANYTLNRSLWPDTLYTFTGYTLAEIAPCLKDLHKLYLSAYSRPQQAIREKYKGSKFGNVSMLSPPEDLPFLLKLLGND
ncbi:cyclin-A1 isoform X2 [Salmo salar]|uniref:Cyclin-A1 isoform X2 n=1 Tax=Salmo salar TaxID=8030 RepID=A0A1S3L2Q4_SALSA|nr:cyclin-A1 isoform X2 [Salmo salar]